VPSPGNALELTAHADQSHVVVSVGGPYLGTAARGADLFNLDLTSGDTSPLLQRSDARESLTCPTWWPDHATLLFERQDLAGQPVGAPGQEVPRYPSRIEQVMFDGSSRGILLADGRQPSASPDGTSLVFARTSNRGASLLVWSQADGGVRTLIPEGRFADVAYPRFSPGSDQIAFVAPQSSRNGHDPEPSRLGLDGLFGPTTAYAHGISWDPWVVNADGSGLRRVAETAADEPSVAWSPDQTQLFIYSGTGSYVVDAMSGAVTTFSFVQGYGSVVWLD
jgi:hypothetical protein